jgi:hypothetical protein
MAHSQDAFDKSYQIHAKTGCWIWQRAKTGAGGQYWEEGIPVPAHQYSWERANLKPASSGYRLIRICGINLCVNPEHIAEVRKNSALTGKQQIAMKRIIDSNEVTLLRDFAMLLGISVDAIEYALEPGPNEFTEEEKDLLRPFKPRDEYEDFGDDFSEDAEPLTRK